MAEPEETRQHIPPDEVFLESKGWKRRGWNWIHKDHPVPRNTKEAILWQELWDQGYEAKRNFVQEVRHPYQMNNERSNAVLTGVADMDDTKPYYGRGTVYKVKRPENKDDPLAPKTGIIHNAFEFMKFVARLFSKIKW